MGLVIAALPFCRHLYADDPPEVENFLFLVNNEWDSEKSYSKGDYT